MLNALSAARWNFQTAAHLLNRAGFGGSPADIEKLRKPGFEKAVDYLVDYEKAGEAAEPPEWAKAEPDRLRRYAEVREFRRKMNAATPEERKELEAKAREMRQMEQRNQRQNVVELRGWW